MRRVFILAPVGKCSGREEHQPSKPTSNDPTPVKERKAPALPPEQSWGGGPEMGTPVSMGTLMMEGGGGAGQLVDLSLRPSESRHRHSARLLGISSCLSLGNPINPPQPKPRVLQGFLCRNGFFPLLPSVLPADPLAPHPAPRTLKIDDLLPKAQLLSVSFLPTMETLSRPWCLSSFT